VNANNLIFCRLLEFTIVDYTLLTVTDCILDELVFLYTQFVKAE